MALGQTLATRRLASSVLVELDACFVALDLTSTASSDGLVAVCRATSGEAA